MVPIHLFKCSCLRTRPRALTPSIPVMPSTVLTTLRGTRPRIFCHTFANLPGPGSNKHIFEENCWQFLDEGRIFTKKNNIWWKKRMFERRLSLVGSGWVRHTIETLCAGISRSYLFCLGFPVRLHGDLFK